MQRDDIYALPQDKVVDFAFNAGVADVFPDMIRRSVPAYETIISMLGVIAQQYVQPHSRIYDLGCSLGAATLAMATRVREEGVFYVGVDNSPAMIDRCRKILDRHLNSSNFELVLADIQNVAIENASIVVLNFTLQFLRPEVRVELLTRIYAGLNRGGVLVLSEKLRFEDADEQAVLTDLHLAFKRANGYSDLEISQKRSAIENVLIPDSAEQHCSRLQDVGFKTVVRWAQGLNFASFIAIKA